MAFHSQVDQQSLDFAGGEGIKGLVIEGGEEGTQQGELEHGHTAFYHRIFSGLWGISRGWNAGVTVAKKLLATARLQFS
jgi:hypothetical protein